MPQSYVSIFNGENNLTITDEASSHPLFQSGQRQTFNDEKIKVLEQQVALLTELYQNSEIRVQKFSSQVAQAQSQVVRFER
jgi:hypothetical protein